MTAISHINAVKPFRQCTPCLWSQNLCHVCPGDWHQCLTYTHTPARPASPNIFSLFYNEVVFSHSCFLPGKHVVILAFPVKRVNQNHVIIFNINYPENVTITSETCFFSQIHGNSLAQARGDRRGDFSLSGRPILCLNRHLQLILVLSLFSSPVVLIY